MSKGRTRSFNVLFIVVVLLILATPYLFTRETILGFDFVKTGSIGDTIGGITAPFINLFAAWLVYVAFKEQVEANSIQKANLDNEIKEREELTSFNIISAELDWCQSRYDKFDWKAFEELVAEKNKGIFDPVKSNILMQRLVGLVGHMNKMYSQIERLETGTYKGVLANKLVLIHRAETSPLKISVEDNWSIFQHLVENGTSEREIFQHLVLDKVIVEKLDEMKRLLY